MERIFAMPLNTWTFSQIFGENRACIEINGTKVITCDGNNPPPGYRSVYGPQGHQGWDLPCPEGTEVYCGLAGHIYAIDANPRTGLDIRVESEYGGRKFRHIHEHLMGIQRKIGDKVETGELLGWAGSTGYSSGPHLHWEIWELLNGNWTLIDPKTVTHMVPATAILTINNRIKYIKELLAKYLDNLAFKMRS